MYVCLHVYMHASMHFCMIDAFLHVCMYACIQYITEVQSRCASMRMNNFHGKHVYVPLYRPSHEHCHWKLAPVHRVAHRHHLERDRFQEFFQGSRKQQNLGFLDWATPFKHTPLGGGEVPSSENRSTVSWSTCSGAGKGVVGARAATRQGVDAPCWSNRCENQKRKVNKICVKETSI